MIGSGVSGLAAIRMLKQLGVDFIVLERGAEAGGVWQQNRYPGAGVDTHRRMQELALRRARRSQKA